MKGIQLVQQRFPEQRVVIADPTTWTGADRPELEDFSFDTISTTSLNSMAPMEGSDVTITPVAAVATDPTRLEVYFKETLKVVLLCLLFRDAPLYVILVI